CRWTGGECISSYNSNSRTDPSFYPENYSRASWCCRIRAVDVNKISGVYRKHIREFECFCGVEDARCHRYNNNTGFFISVCQSTGVFYNITFVFIYYDTVFIYNRVYIVFYISFILILVMFTTIDTGTIAFDFTYIFLFIKEIGVGLLIGLIAYIILSAVQIAGGFIDFQMGFAVANVIDPQTGAQSPLIGQ